MSYWIHDSSNYTKNMSQVSSKQWTKLTIFLKPVWTHGIQLWRTAVENLQRYQNKTLKGFLKVPLAKVNSKVTFNLFSLLQLTDKTKLTFSKIWQCRCNIDNFYHFKKWQRNAFLFMFIIVILFTNFVCLELSLFLS